MQLAAGFWLLASGRQPQVAETFNQKI